jgi:hypothetical protein
MTKTHKFQMYASTMSYTEHCKCPSSVGNVQVAFYVDATVGLSELVNRVQELRNNVSMTHRIKFDLSDAYAMLAHFPTHDAYTVAATGASHQLIDKFPSAVTVQTTPQIILHPGEDSMPHERAFSCRTNLGAASTSLSGLRKSAQCRAVGRRALGVRSDMVLRR